MLMWMGHTFELSFSGSCSGSTFSRPFYRSSAFIGLISFCLFLSRFQRRIFEEGKVFVAVPPLYKVTTNQRQTYCYDDAALKKLTKGKSAKSYSIQRFKGLGEMMPAQLWDTTLNPATRTLRRLTVEDVSETSSLFALLMGNQVEHRKKLIQEEGRRIGLANLDI